MLRYVVRRLLLLVPILLGVSLLIFFWIRALPGSPAESLLGERATPQLVHQLRERYGLDKPVYQQYFALPAYDGQHPIVGSWVIDQEAAGVGIRESAGLVTLNASPFVPHIIADR